MYSFFCIPPLSAWLVCRRPSANDDFLNMVHKLSTEAVTIRHIFVKVTLSFFYAVVACFPVGEDCPLWQRSLIWACLASWSEIPVIDSQVITSEL